MLQLFYEKRDVFQLKELEKLAPKEKGVIAQAVKDVVQTLVDDGLVDSEKIGTSVYFWSFPSKAANVRKRKIEHLETEAETTGRKLAVTEEQVEKARVGREESEERSKLLEDLAQAETHRKDLLARLDKFKDCDPDVLDAVRAQTATARDAINRWTDNICSIKSWVKNKFFIEDSVLNKQFGIPEDLDYL
ncbi:meiotic nuclear division protein 1 homolog isoform X2 [Ornithodoros turicata]